MKQPFKGGVSTLVLNFFYVKELLTEAASPSSPTN